MLKPWVVAEIRRLLAEGRKQIEVSARTGVSRGSVRSIANGRRPEYPSRAGEVELSPDDSKERCPGCGGMTRMPCPTCAARWRMKFFRQRPHADDSWELDASLRLELKGEHRARYEEIRRQKIARGETPVEPSRVQPLRGPFQGPSARRADGDSNTESSVIMGGIAARAERAVGEIH